ncbi:MAG: uroporphyrinogen-III C-methyltransferase, partial [Glaciimonas sp.]|nr:uroporphyrinogen-III C-methyltransferase [Glaciimonas sp.]
MTPSQPTPTTPDAQQPTLGSAASAASSSQAQAASPPYTPAANKQVKPSKQLGLIYALLLLLAGLLAAMWWTSHNENTKLRTELAQRLQIGDSSNNDTKQLAKLAEESTKELQAKVAVLENKQTESQSQQLALAQMYQDLSKNGDDWALAEVEDVLSTANQQLQLAGNVQGSLIALENADKNLARSDKAQFVAIRSAIARDIDRLKALPTLDITGISVRLDSLIGQIDSMPLLSDEKPVAIANRSAVADAKPANSKANTAKSGKGAVADTNASSINDTVSANWGGKLKDTWQSWTTELWGEVRQLIRVRTASNSDALLLSPTQSYYVRENLKLRLLNARLGLLSHNETAFRSDLIASQEIITNYFDTRAKQ